MAATLKARAQTHCVHGHELAGDNLRIESRTHGRKCRTCANAAKDRWRVAHPERVRDGAKEKAYWLRVRYNLTLGQYDALWRNQRGACAICRRTVVGVKAVHVDHDHRCCPGKRSCGHCVRGLLCLRCNLTVNARNTPDLLRRAADYVEAFP